MTELEALEAVMENIDPATWPGLSTAQRCALGRFAKPANTSDQALLWPLDAPQETIPCDHCDGSGKDPLPMAIGREPDPCPFCHGNGYVRKVPVMKHFNINCNQEGR